MCARSLIRLCHVQLSQCVQQAQAGVETDLATTRTRLDSMNGFAQRMVITHLRDRTFSGSSTAGSEMSLPIDVGATQEEARAPSSTGAALAASQNPIDEFDANDDTETNEEYDSFDNGDAETDEGGGASALLARLEASKSKRQRAVSVARMINRRRSSTASTNASLLSVASTMSES